MEGVQQRPLKYSIHACSSHSGGHYSLDVLKIYPFKKMFITFKF